MASTADILIIGGGIAGLSAAAELAKNASVTVLEAEDQLGFHASGRSATMLHYALGDAVVRELTLASRPFFEDPPPPLGDVPLARRMPVLIHARDDELDALDALEADLAPFAALERLDAAGVHRLCPLLKGDARYGLADFNGLRLDPHAMLQANLRVLRAAGGELRTGRSVATIDPDSSGWRVTTEDGEAYSSGIVVNAAGAWADQLAHRAGVAPLGLEPKRRTIITFEAPAHTDLEHLPFTKTVGEELYFAPESGRLFASPMDEVSSDPCDAQPDEMEVALAAYRMEERTVVKVERIHSRWAGLRTFTPDRRPAIGFADGAPGFFWCAGQGGFGLQTSSALARTAAALIFERDWPVPSVSKEELRPGRFFRDSA